MKNLINLEAVSSLKGIGEPGLFNRLVDLFSETGAQQVQQLGQAFSEENWKKLSAEAHSLKSSAQSLGAELLADICAQLENDQLGFEQKRSLLQDLEVAFKSAIDELLRLKDPH